MQLNAVTKTMTLNNKANSKINKNALNNNYSQI